MKRHKLHKTHSKKMFTRNAQRVHPKNGLKDAGSLFAMRGGIRF